MGDWDDLLTAMELVRGARRMHDLTLALIFTIVQEMGADIDYKIVIGSLGCLAGSIAAEHDNPERVMRMFNVAAHVAETGEAPP